MEESIYLKCHLAGQCYHIWSAAEIMGNIHFDNIIWQQASFPVQDGRLGLQSLTNRTDIIGLMLPTHLLGFLHYQKYNVGQIY